MIAWEKVLLGAAPPIGSALLDLAQPQRRGVMRRSSLPHSLFDRTDQHTSADQHSLKGN